MSKLNIAVIGEVSVGKSSFINSFVNKPISTVSLRRETFVPIKFIFEGNTSEVQFKNSMVENEKFRKEGNLPELKLKELKVGKYLDYFNSITDYPGLNDSNDNRDILGFLIDKLPEYDVVIFVTKAERAFVSQSEYDLWMRLAAAVEKSNELGNYCKLLCVVAQYYHYEEELEEIVKENIEKKKIQPYRWNSFNAILQSYNYTEFKSEYIKDWQKISKLGDKKDAFDFNDLMVFLAKQYYTLESDKAESKLAFNSIINNFSKLSGAIDYYENLKNEIHKNILAKKIREFITNQKSGDIDVIIKACNLGLIPILETVPFLKEVIMDNSQFQTYFNFLSKFTVDDCNKLFGKWLPIYYNETYYSGFTHLDNMFLISYIKEELETFSTIRIKDVVKYFPYIKKFKYLVEKVENWLKTDANIKIVIFRNLTEIMDFYPHLFPIRIYSKNPVKLSKIFYETENLYPGYIKQGYFNDDCHLCRSKTSSYYNNNIYICYICNPCKSPVDLFLRDQELYTETEKIEIIDIISSKYDTPLYKVAKWSEKINLKNFPEAENILKIIDLYEGFEFIESRNPGDIQKYIKISGKIRDMKVGCINTSFADNLKRKYVILKYTNDFIKFCYQNLFKKLTQKDIVKYSGY